MAPRVEGQRKDSGIGLGYGRWECTMGKKAQIRSDRIGSDQDIEGRGVDLLLLVWVNVAGTRGDYGEEYGGWMKCTSQQLQSNNSEPKRALQQTSIGIEVEEPFQRNSVKYTAAEK